GSRMLDLIEQHGQVDTVVDVLVDEYDAGVEKIATDLRVLLDELKEQGIVRCQSFTESVSESVDAE
ncbi:MAG: PqqD family peptide modification chaperone, partial [Gammaproteobacteria bacterium]|nr:PqqD family peptide modification chaperone [Gammaproteobacteria bacterium]